MLTADAWLLLASRGLRLFAYGFLSVGLALVLTGRGFSTAQIGTLFTVALAGGAAMTALVALLADRFGRRRSLILTSLLLAASGAVLALSDSFALMLAVAALGTISPGTQDVGPYQSLEQAALAQTTRPALRVRVYAWYNLAGQAAAALGALAVAVARPGLLVWSFAACGIVLAALAALMSPRVEAPQDAEKGERPGLGPSRGIVVRLFVLYGFDSLASGLVVQSLIALWLHRRFGLGPEALGPLFFATSSLSALSYLAAVRLSDRIGLLNTMVFTHIPANLFLCLVPLMPAWPLAALCLLLRSALSQMDVPTRQAYIMAVVSPGERAAAAGLTNGVLAGAASVAPLISGAVLQTAAAGAPFVAAGLLKIAYDLALYFMFRRVPLRSDQDAVSGVRA